MTWGCCSGEDSCCEERIGGGGNSSTEGEAPKDLKKIRNAQLTTSSRGCSGIWARRAHRCVDLSLFAARHAISPAACPPPHLCSTEPSYKRRNPHLREQSLQTRMDIPKSRAIRRRPVPALQHESVDRGRTADGGIHAEALLQQRVHICQLYSGVGSHAVGGNFPQQDTEGPDVALGGEGVVGKPFGGCPLDGELGAGMRCVGVLPHESRQAEVGNFHDVAVCDEAVAGGQIPVSRRISLCLLSTPWESRGDPFAIVVSSSEHKRKAGNGNDHSVFAPRGTVIDQREMS